MFCHSGLLPAGRQVTRNPVFVLAGSRLGGRDDTKNYVRRTYRAPLVVPSFFTIPFPKRSFNSRSTVSSETIGNNSKNVLFCKNPFSWINSTIFICRSVRAICWPPKDFLILRSVESALTLSLIRDNSIASPSEKYSSQPVKLPPSLPTLWRDS